MVTELPGNAIPAPGYRKGNISTDIELMASMNGYTQKGVTLKAGQGVLLPGTPLARDAATKRYVKYTSGECAGLLRTGVDTGTDPAGAEFQGNVVVMGIAKLSVISAAASGVLAAAITALSARVNTPLDHFKF